MLKNMKIGTRMVTAFVIIILLSILLAVIATTQIKSVANATSELYNKPFQIVDATWDMRESMVKIEKYILRGTIEETVKDTQEQFDLLSEEASHVLKRAEEAKAIYIEDKQTQRIEDIDSIVNTLTSASDAREKIQNYALALENEKAIDVLDQEYLPRLSEASDGLLQLSESARVKAESFYLEAASDAQQALMIVIILAVAQVILAIVIALVITSSITRPLNKIKDAAEHVARGNIDIQIDHKSKDELGNLAETFRSVIRTLNLLNEDMAQLKKWATEGKILERAQDNDKIQGAYKEIINGVNGIMDTFTNHFNAIPVGVTVVDTNKILLFENKTAVEYKSISEDNIQRQSSDFADETGKTVGSLAITIDQTMVMEAQRESERQAANVAEQMRIAQKQADFQKLGVSAIQSSIEKLAVGDLEIKLNSDISFDDDTKEIYDTLKGLDESLVKSAENIRGYIDELSEVLGKIAGKDLTIGITREYLGDFAALKTSINNIADNLNQVFGEIAGATNQVQSGSQQVANSAQTLAQGASEQASAVEQISSTIAEVASQTKSNAENASKANEMSLSAKTDAETGSRQMDEMVNAMEAIKEASKGIASIIKVIEDIAFQTNILALNAAVEAARAGEHGKGFAVVAEEVRTLAARSATAAKETTDMIDNSLARVEIGSKIAADTAQALNKIVTGVTGTVDIVATIAEASAQQASAISQIDNGVEQISKVTQTNTATAEESASASEEMAGQAQTLQNMVGEFSLRGKGKGGQQKSVAKAISGPKPSAEASKDEEISISLEDENFSGGFGKY